MDLKKELADELIDLARQFEEECAPQYLAVVERVSQTRRMVKGEYAPGDWFHDKTWQWRSTEDSVDYDKDSAPRFKYPISVLQACWLILQGAIQTVGIPGSTFRPQNSQQAEDREAAKSASEIINYQRTVVDFRDLLLGIFRLFFTDGLCLGYTRHVKDANRFGTTTVPRSITEPQVVQDAGYQCFNCNEFVPQGQTARDAMGMIHCPTCGYELHAENFMEQQVEDVEVGTEQETKVNGREITDLYGALETLLPWWANDLDHAQFCKIETEVAKEEVVASFADDKDKKRALRIEEQVAAQSSSSSKPGDLERRNARSPMNSTGFGISENFISYARWWFRPQCFYRVVDKKRRAELLKLFPTGVFFQLAGVGEPVFLDAYEEKMESKLELMRPFKGDGMYTPAIGQAGVPIELSVTDAYNMALEGMLFAGFPEMIVDGKIHNGNAINSRRVSPGGVRVVNLEGGKTLKDSWDLMVSPDISQAVERFLQSAIPWLEFLLGTERVLQGGPITNVRTSSGQSQARSQALQRQAPAYGAAKKGLAGIQEKMVNEFMVNRSAETYFEVTNDAGDYERRKIQLNPERGRVIAFPEVSESIPHTWAQSVDSINQIVESAAQNPVTASWIAYPKNARLVYDAMGVSGFVHPQQALVDKYERLIGMLLEGQPQMQEAQNDLAPELGPAQVPTPSLLFDPVADDAEIFLVVFREWAATPEGMKIQIEGGPGYQNLRAYAEQANTARKLAMAPAQPQEQQNQEQAA